MILRNSYKLASKYTTASIEDNYLYDPYYSKLEPLMTKFGEIYVNEREKTYILSATALKKIEESGEDYNKIINEIINIKMKDINSRNSLYIY